MLSDLEDFLLLRSKEEYDYKWAIEFESWNRGDCSYHHLLTVVLMREFELSNSGIFGTRDDVKDSIRQLQEFVETVK
ncbi:hypothetical protein 2019Dha007_0860 [Vibrio phage ICP1]|nr:hypothetical protein 2019Dha007_0860 [Vibrio phage ICP1]QVW07131.1 hypothetical protein 2019DhaG_0855 [Vibrio phage ICP1]QVW07353.1 hypothetical protein 2019DhaH_0860 [Vibrio phage ICP1]QVW07576.1 hypothetical protein 2019DhaI_0865 [Vibrio phage ICP1]